MIRRSRPNPISAKRRQRSRLYLKVRALVLKRDNYTCLVCKGRATDTHHILYRSQGGPDESWNLASLCRGCHDQVHTAGPSYWRPTLHEIVALREAM